MPPLSLASVAVSAIAALTVTLASAQAAGDGMPRDLAARSAGGLQARLALTADEQELRRVWETSPTPPRLSVTDRVRLGTSASTVILFRGCQADAAGRRDVRVDFAVTGPDGKSQDAGSASLWSAAPLGQKFMLGAASASLAFHGDEDLGNYTVRARLVDRVAGRQLELSVPLRVER